MINVRKKEKINDGWIVIIRNLLLSVQRMV